MGAGESKHVASSQNNLCASTTVYTKFTDAERHSALKILTTISKGKNVFDCQQLEEFLQKWDLDTFCVSAVELMKDGKDGSVNEVQFLAGVHKIVSSAADEQAHFIYTTSQNPTNTIQQILRSLVKSCIQFCILSAQGQTWNFGGHDITQDVIRSCTFLEEELKTFQKEQCASTDDYERWISNTCHLAAIFIFVFRSIFLEWYTRSSLFPSCVSCSRAHSLLSPGSLLIINLFMPFDFRQEWQILFDSKVDGESFSRFICSVNDKGSCIMVIMDDCQNVFGVFASHGISIGPNFIGDARCFLFGSHPKVDVYTATGYDQNFAYANQNVKTLPNGVGFGGSIGNGTFGLYLDDQLKLGQSRHCSTFNSPPLSTHETFEISRIQVFKVAQPTVTHNLNTEADGRSVLDKNADARVLLELAGKSRHSEGLREPQSPD